MVSRQQYQNRSNNTVSCILRAPWRDAKQREKGAEKCRIPEDERPNAPVVIYVSFWYRYSVARRHQRCTSQSIAVRHDKPVGHKTEISQPPKYNAAINRNRNSPLPFNRNAVGKKWIAGDRCDGTDLRGTRYEQALFRIKSSVTQCNQTISGGTRVLRRQRSNCNIM